MTGLDTGAKISDKEAAERAIIRARTMPWSNEWKYVTAARLFAKGADIPTVKKTLGLSTPWLLKAQLIKVIELSQKVRKGNMFVVETMKVLRPVR